MYEPLSEAGNETGGPVEENQVSLHVQSAPEEPIVVAEPIAAPVNPLQWSCPRCTLSNTKQESRCNACGCPQPGVAPPPQAIVNTEAPPAYGESTSGPFQASSSAPWQSSAPDTAAAPRANPYVGGNFSGRPTPSQQAYPNAGGRYGQQGGGGGGGMFGGGMFGSQQLAGDANEEEMKRETCARVGCMCSCCCPCVGIGTYCMNKDAVPGTRRHQFARMACTIGVIMLCMNIMLFVVRSQQRGQPGE